MRREYGSIQRLGRNHYRVRWWANDDAGVWKHMSHNVRGTRSDAADFLAQKKIEHGNDSPDPRKRRMSVDQAYKLYYLPWAERRVGDGRMAPSSLNMFRSAWRAHVQPRWGQTMLSDVTALDVEEWLLSLPPSVAPHSKAVMKRTFERARIAGVTTADPFSARLDMPKKPATKRKATYPRATLDAAWQALRGEPCEAAYLLCAYAGCRPGEALGVRPWETVYGECDGTPVVVARINRTVGDGCGTDGPDGRAKTRESIRAVVVVGEPASRLHEIAERRAASGQPWLSTIDGTKVCGKKELRAEIRRCCAADGVDAPMPQLMRPSWETWARHELHVQPDVIERLMGHVDQSIQPVTREHYDRPSAGTLVEPFVTAWRCAQRMPK